jgi:hypothetical protein
MPPQVADIDPKSPGIYELIKRFIATGIVPLCIEMLRLFPDGVVFGTAILAALSFCKSYGVLLFAMVELMLIQRLFASVIGSIAPVGAGQNASADVCMPGFMFPNSMRISLLEIIGKPSLFPSPTVFFLTGILSYMVGAMQEFKREIETLGGSLQTRTTVALVLSVLLAFVLFAFRFTYGCESFGTLLISMILGLIFGLLLLIQNKALFDRDGINILNLPLIVTALERGKPMYVCSPTS